MTDDSNSSVPQVDDPSTPNVDEGAKPQVLEYEARQSRNDAYELEQKAKEAASAGDYSQAKDLRAAEERLLETAKQEDDLARQKRSG